MPTQALLSLVACVGVTLAKEPHHRGQAYQYLVVFDDSNQTGESSAREKRGSVAHGTASSYIETSGGDGYGQGYSTG